MQTFHFSNDRKIIKKITFQYDSKIIEVVKKNKVKKINVINDFQKNK